MQRQTRDAYITQQIPFQKSVRATLQDLLLQSLKTLDSDSLADALHDHILKERDKWKVVIGEDEFNEFQRVLVLSAIDREWRDYLTAADDLRREIGLEAAGRQRDPKIEYKKRSFEMFADMKQNIERELGETYFRRIGQHQDYLKRQQEQEAAFKAQLQGTRQPTQQKAKKAKASKKVEKRQQAASQQKMQKPKKKKTIRRKKR